MKKNKKGYIKIKIMKSPSVAFRKSYCQHALSTLLQRMSSLFCFEATFGESQLKETSSPNRSAENGFSRNEEQGHIYQ